jgi:hypothetical protein
MHKPQKIPYSEAEMNSTWQMEGPLVLMFLKYMGRMEYVVPEMNLQVTNQIIAVTSEKDHNC